LENKSEGTALRQKPDRKRENERNKAANRQISLCVTRTKGEEFRCKKAGDLSLEGQKKGPRLCG